MTTPTNFQADAHPSFFKTRFERFYGWVFIGWILVLLAFDLFTLRRFPVRGMMKSCFQIPPHHFNFAWTLGEHRVVWAGRFNILDRECAGL